MPVRYFEMLALAGYFLASLLAVAAQLNPRAARPRHALALSLTAFVLHGMALLFPALGGRFDLKMVFLGIGWTLYAASTAAGLVRRERLGPLQAASYPLCALVFLAAVLQPDGDGFRISEAGHKAWFASHLATLGLGMVLAVVGSIYSVLYLLEDGRLRGSAAISGGALPPLETSDRIAIRLLGAGLALLSFGIFAGLVLLRGADESRPPGDPVIVVTLALWGVALAILLARAAGALSGRRSAWLQILAALLAACAVGALGLH